MRLVKEGAVFNKRANKFVEPLSKHYLTNSLAYSHDPFFIDGDKENGITLKMPRY